MYVPLDVDFPHDPKIEQVGLDGAGLYCIALCYAKRLLTDGRLTRHKLRKEGASDELIDALVRADLFRTLPDAPDDIVITAWLDHNDSADEVAAKRSTEAQRKRTARRAARLSSTDGPANVRPDKSKVRPESDRSPVNVQPLEVEIETEVEIEHSLAVVPKSEPTKKPRRSPALPFPADFTLTSEMREEAEGKGIRDVDREWEKFRLHAEANDRRQANWLAAWRNWVLNSPNFTKPATNGVARVSHVDLQRQKLAASLERMTR